VWTTGDDFGSIGNPSTLTAEDQANLKAYLGHGIEQCSPAQLVELRGIYGAIRDGEATWKTVMENIEDNPKEPKEPKKPIVNNLGQTKGGVTETTKPDSDRYLLGSLLQEVSQLTTEPGTQLLGKSEQLTDADKKKFKAALKSRAKELVIEQDDVLDFESPMPMNWELEISSCQSNQALQDLINGMPEHAVEEFQDFINLKFDLFR
jgi:hypothetical protein